MNSDSVTERGQSEAPEKEVLVLLWGMLQQADHYPANTAGRPLPCKHSTNKHKMCVLVNHKEVIFGFPLTWARVLHKILAGCGWRYHVAV